MHAYDIEYKYKCAHNIIKLCKLNACVRVLTRLYILLLRNHSVCRFSLFIAYCEPFEFLLKISQKIKKQNETNDIIPTNNIYIYLFYLRTTSSSSLS